MTLQMCTDGQGVLKPLAFKVSNSPINEDASQRSFPFHEETQ